MTGPKGQSRPTCRHPHACGWLLFILALIVLVSPAQAAIVLVSWGSGVQQGNTLVAATFSTAPVEGNLLVAIVGNRDSRDPPPTPAGWTRAREETGNSPGQVIFYKIAGAGEPSMLTVGPYSSNVNLGMHIYEYSGVDTSDPLQSSLKVAGSGTAVSTGLITASADGSLILAGFMHNASTSFSGWTNSFVEEWDFVNGGGPTTRSTYAGVDLVAGTAGTYSTSATTGTSGDWIGQVVVFNPTPPPVIEYIVTNSNNSGVGSLRAAIDYANLNPSATIIFDIPDSDTGYQTDGTDHWWRIAPTAALPLITTSGTIVDGATQTTRRGDLNSRGPEIEIYGGGLTADGLAVFAVGNCVIRDLAINSFDGHGIQINGLGAVGNDVFGCYLGTDAVGEAALPNTGEGVWITNGASDVDIGGSDAGEGNLISGNSRGVVINSGSTIRIIGNKLGTDRIGTSAIANGNGIYIAGTSSGVTVGGSATGAGNLVSGNSLEQILIEGSAGSITIQGNTVGTDPSGTIDLSSSNGVHLETAANPSNILVGGLLTGEGNLLAYNTSGVMCWWIGGGHRIQGNTMRSNSSGLAVYAPDIEVSGNLILNSSGRGAFISTSGVGTKFYQNTIHGSGNAGIEISNTGSLALHNCIITGNGSLGVYLNGGTMDSESHNLITDNLTNPPNGGRGNIAFDASDLNADPLYVDAGGGDYSLTECTSPAVNAGTDLGADQPDMNGSDPGSYNGSAPDMGCSETACLAAGYSIAGIVFEDVNFAGTATDYDSGTDLGLANVDVELYDAGPDTLVASVVTGVGGSYSFLGVPDGSYKVRVRSATIGDADTPPAGGLNGTVGTTWPYPLPEMTWGNGSALYGGQDAAVDDADTGDDAGPGDTYVSVTMSGATVSGVNLGFAYNLIVNTLDDGVADDTRSDQGSLRQFLKNANAITNGTAADSSQFRMQVTAGQIDGTDSWWRIAPTTALPALADGGAVLDGSTQTANGGNSNTRGPEIEINGAAVPDVYGLTVTSADNRILGLVVNGFTTSPGTGILLDGAAAAGNRIAGCYISPNAVGDDEDPNFYGITLSNGASGTVIGEAGNGNVISGNDFYGIYLDNAGANTTVQGNRIGTNAVGDAAMPNSNGIYIDGGTAIVIGGSGAGEGNLISGNVTSGINLQFGDDVTIQGNWMGLNQAGTDPLPDGGTAVYGWSVDNVTVGGSAPGEGNIIAGNDGAGVSLGAGCQSWVVQGNTIGAGPLGTETNLGNTGTANIRISPNDITIDATIGGENPGEGNLIAYASGPGINCSSIGAAVKIIGNVIRNNAEEGITARVDSLTIAMNLIHDNGAGFDGIILQDVAADGKVYQNTIHGSGDDGIEIVGTNQVVRNNIITGNAGYGINLNGGTMTESNNLVTGAATSPANALGRSNVALDASDLDADPLYVDAPGDDFSLTECTSPAINAGLDLGAAQPDMNGASAGLYTGPAPDMGATETGCLTVSVSISGLVFEDLDFAGTASAYASGTDSALANVDVELYDAANGDTLMASVVTGVGGTYSFGDLPDGTYKVRARSATIGDTDTPPAGGLNGTVGTTWPYPLPEMTWGYGAALYGGQSDTTDDADTGDDAGPGDTYVSVTVSGASVTGVDLGFAYNLIVNTADDGLADSTRSDQGSLRQFLKNANAITNGTAADNSEFRIPNSDPGYNWTGNGEYTIGVAAVLPTLRDPLVIDGSTQPGFGTTPIIEINGGGIFTPTDGLTIKGGNSTLQSIVVNGFWRDAVVIDSLGGNTVVGCYLGLGPDGATAKANFSAGVQVKTGSNYIGGLKPGDGNVISGNMGVGVSLSGLGATGNFLYGNYIGTDEGGTLDRGNSGVGVQIFSGASGNTVGGTAAGARNVIAGNTQGIQIVGNGSTGNIVQGNFIGTDRTGLAGFGNDADGVSILSGAAGNTIGGTAAGARNVISGNGSQGVMLDGPNTTGNVITGNHIGADSTGLGSLPNDHEGVLISGNANGNTIGGMASGAGNTIAYNLRDGVFVTGSDSDRNLILGNSIFSNTELGIDLALDGVGTGGDANNDKAPPVLVSVIPGGGAYTVVATAAPGDTLEFFRANNAVFPTLPTDPSGSGEGFLYLGRCIDNGPITGPHLTAGTDGDVTDGSVQVTVLTSGLSSTDHLSATATTATDGTSEFAVNMQPAAGPPLAVVKRAFLANGDSLSSGSVVPKGRVFNYLLYINNPGPARSDVSVLDVLDPDFEYILGTAKVDTSRANCAAADCDAAEELAIFNTVMGVGADTDAVDLDVLSYTVGTRTIEAGNRITGNARLDIPENSICAITFTVRMR